MSGVEKPIRDGRSEEENQKGEEKINRPSLTKQIADICKGEQTDTFIHKLQEYFSSERNKQKIFSILKGLLQKKIYYKKVQNHLLFIIKFLCSITQKRPNQSFEEEYNKYKTDLKEIYQVKDQNLFVWIHQIKQFISQRRILSNIIFKITSESQATQTEQPTKNERFQEPISPTKIILKKKEEEFNTISQKIAFLCKEYQLEGDTVYKQIDALQNKINDMNISFEKRVRERVNQKTKELEEQKEQIKNGRDAALLELKKIIDKQQKKKQHKKTRKQNWSEEKKEKKKQQTMSIEKKMTKKVEEQPLPPSPKHSISPKLPTPTLQPSQTPQSLKKSERFLNPQPVPQKKVEERSRTPTKQITPSSNTGTGFLFQSDIISQTNESQIRFLRSKIGRLGKTRIKTWKLLFSSNKTQDKETNAHSYFDNHTCLLFLVKLVNGTVVGGYTKEPFCPGCTGSQGFIFSLTRHEAFEKVQGSTISYNEQSIVFGKNQLRIKPKDMSLFSNFGASQRNFLSNNKDINYFLGCGEEKVSEIAVLQIFQILEE